MAKDTLFSTLQPLSQIHKLASLSLLYCYIHSECSDKFHSLVPPVRTFLTKTLLATSTDLTYSYHYEILW